MFGNYALYHEGWMLVGKVTRPSWVTAGPQDPDPAKGAWARYDISSDWTQDHDIAAEYPDKVKELEAVWWQEAEKYQVLPLDSSVVSRLVVPRPSVTAGRTLFEFPGRMTGISNGVAPTILNASYTFTADLTVPEGGGSGMIITQGGRFAGYGLYLKDGKPTFTWNLVGLQHVTWQAPEPLSPGKHTVEFDFKYDGLGMGTLAFNDFSGIGRPGTGTLKVDGQAVATEAMPHTIPLILAWDENMDIGSDTGTPVDDAVYKVPFAFTGLIDDLKLSIDRPVLSDADKARLEAAMTKKD
jgi:arylsulfatase